MQKIKHGDVRLPHKTKKYQIQCSKSLIGKKHGIHRESPGQNFNRGENRMCFFPEASSTSREFDALGEGLAFWPEEQVCTNTVTLCEVCWPDPSP